GTGGEGCGRLTEPIGDERAQVREAGTTLARARAGERRALEELEVREAAFPRALEIFDGRTGARTHDADGRARGEGEALGRGADGAHCRIVGHPAQGVARRTAQTDDDGIALDALVADDDMRDPLGAFEPGERAGDPRPGNVLGHVADAHDGAERDASSSEL